MQAKVVVTGLIGSFREKATEFPQIQLVGGVIEILKMDAGTPKYRVGVTLIVYY
jgi:hypothetical protein